MQPLRRLAALLLAALAVLPGCGGEGRAAAPAPQTGESWAKLRIKTPNGYVRAGHVYTRVRRLELPEHGAVVERHAFTRMRIKRLGAQVDVQVTETTRERAEDGTLVSMRTEQKMARHATVREATFEDGWANLETTVMGKSRESRMRCPADAVGPHWVERKTLALGFEQGASFQATLFQPDLGGAREVEVVVAGEEDGLHRVEMRFKGLPYAPTTWYRPSGEVARMRVALGGIELEMVTCRKEEALEEDDGELPPDVFRNTLVVAPHGIAAARRVERAVLHVRARAEMPDLAHRRFQTVETNDRGETLVTIRTVVPENGGVRPLADPPEDVRSSLAANSMIQSDAPRIVAIAKDVAGDEQDAWRAARALESWVKAHITEKSLDIGLASALEVCENREGDCTEHAVLLAALCRAAGIPARVCMGLEYIGGVWGGHAWNEVRIDGRWYPLDATNGYGFVDALHLTLASMDLGDASFGEAFAQLAGALGNLEIEILEATRAGRTIRPAGLNPETDGDTFRDPDWGLTLNRPEGWTFRLPKRGRKLSSLLVELRGKDASIAVHASDRPAGFSWDDLEDGKRIEVAGRRAHRIDSPAGAQVSLATDLALFRLILNGDAPESFDAVLQSIALD